MPVETIKSAVATIQVGAVKSDGDLMLTDTEVIFEPFNLQFGLGPYRFERNSIASVSKCLGKGGGVIPISCDAMRISLSNKQVFEFIIASPEQWISDLSTSIT